MIYSNTRGTTNQCIIPIQYESAIVYLYTKIAKMNQHLYHERLLPSENLLTLRIRIFISFTKVLLVRPSGNESAK